MSAVASAASLGASCPHHTTAAARWPALRAQQSLPRPPHSPAWLCKPCSPALAAVPAHASPPQQQEGSSAAGRASEPREAASCSGSLQEQAAQAEALVQACAEAQTHQQKSAILLGQRRCQQFLSSSPGRLLNAWLRRAQPAHQHICLVALALGQQHVFELPGAEPEGAQRVYDALAQRLQRVEAFYSCIGGLAGYQALSLRTMLASQAGSADTAAEGTSQAYHMPQGLRLDFPSQASANAVAQGIEALPHMAEIYPLGGAGDRLGLKCDVTGECVPAAVLLYCGRTLLEGLMRDVQAREWLYFCLHGKQHTTPIAMMTSDAKDNHRRMGEVMRAFDWFGRGQASFRLFRQPLVPVISSEDGRWLLPSQGVPMLKPGGHGAIWKLMQDEGVFAWLASRDRQAAIVRQISNPLAGTDTTLLGLAGAGWADGRSFGFAACDRTVGASEGINAILERRLPLPDRQESEYSFNVTNVEYTEFERLGICDEGEGGSGISRFPANTNVLYVGLQAAEMAVAADVSGTGGAMLPGMIFNTRKRVSYTDALSGENRSVLAGRLECTMQNLVDQLGQTFREPIPTERMGSLNTFVVFNHRRKVTSSAKKRRAPGSTALAQTPDGSFRDLMLNAVDLLRLCQYSSLPEVGDAATYLQQGPGLIFLFHPALGPTWDVISQKLRGGRIAPHSEVVLEVAEAAVTDLRVEGSLLVQADSPLGCLETAPLQQQPSGGVFEDAPQGARRLVYSSLCGRLRLHSVTVLNQGVDWGHSSNVFWAHKVHRREATRIILHGQAEFEASDVVLSGDHIFEVPDGYRMEVRPGPRGALRRFLYPLPQRQPSWKWEYSMGTDRRVQLTMWEPSVQSALLGLGLAPDTTPFVYMI